ncbi:MAG: adenylate/guanylate cyclase domain-containing protein, partial [Chloroflexi bacterium]|nr:adenylate/guanylate cyclase domain-containing protein [Chloroflexota bacterium]
ADFPPLRSLESFPNNLPVQLTTFIGRERELAETKRLLATTHLLTLTGPGGTGKTRLSLQLAADVLDTFADGVWLSELAPLADPALIPLTIANVLGVREQPTRSLNAVLRDFLRDKCLLLILDNCEHLIEACAQLADEVLHASPQLRIVTSSREPLGIAGETVFRVPPLSVPVLSPEFNLSGSTQDTALSMENFESVRLFGERAGAVRADFVLSDANANAIAQICVRLDGIPLAIELAAARVKSLSVAEIAARLDNQFRLLTGGSRTALPRQQILRALIDWSYNLLSEPECVLFRRLAAFAGGWTLEAAEAVCGEQSSVNREPSVMSSEASRQFTVHSSLLTDEILDLLDSLVNKSLVIAEPRDGDTRYRFLETIRQYARDKLLESGESERVRDRQLDYME